MKVIKMEFVCPVPESEEKETKSHKVSLSRIVGEDTAILSFAWSDIVITKKDVQDMLFLMDIQS